MAGDFIFSSSWFLSYVKFFKKEFTFVVTLNYGYVDECVEPRDTGTRFTDGCDALRSFTMMGTWREDTDLAIQLLAWRWRGAGRVSCGPRYTG